MSRRIGFRELPARADTKGKVLELVAAVRRAVAGDGEVENELYQHVCQHTLSFCSDGADRGVGDAATELFERMAFRTWDESHSSIKVLQHALEAAEEARYTEELLVSRQKPYSLAKFMDTSDVMRQNFVHAQQFLGTCLVKDLGFAPRRFNRHCRPMGRTSRRWQAL